MIVQSRQGHSVSTLHRNTSQPSPTCWDTGPAHASPGHPAALTARPPWLCEVQLSALETHVTAPLALALVSIPGTLLGATELKEFPGQMGQSPPTVPEELSTAIGSESLV